MTQIAINQITRLVAQSAGITYREILSSSRMQRYAVPRQAAYWLVRRNSPLSYPLIAREFCKDDHTTIMHGVKRTQRRIAEDSGFAVWMNNLEAIIRSEAEKQ